MAGVREAKTKAGDGPVKTVEVSGDGGNTWVEAELDFGEHDVRTDEGKRKAKWSWCLWKNCRVLRPDVSGSGVAGPRSCLQMSSMQFVVPALLLAPVPGIVEIVASLLEQKRRTSVSC